MLLAPQGSHDSLKTEANCSTGASLDPALKDFLDRVIIPALIREFTKTLLANSGGAKAQSSQQARRED
jgi:hypothetical protein